MRLSLFSVFILLPLAACSSAQNTAAQADLQTANQAIATACHVATVAEAADPALASHNKKIVAYQTTICTVNGVLMAMEPLTPAPVPAP